MKTVMGRGLRSALLGICLGGLFAIVPGGCEHGPRFDPEGCPHGYCGAEVTGAVKDLNTGEPINQVEVVIGSCGDYTDYNGVFELYDCEPGCYGAVVARYDYEPTVVSVELQPGYNTLSPFSLSPAQRD